MPFRVRRLLLATLDLFYPPHCEFCHQPIAHGLLCVECLRGIRWIQPPRCEVCSLPVCGRGGRAFVCANCRTRQFHFQFAVCGCEAEGVVRQLIHRFKYHQVMRLEALLARLLFHAWRDPRIGADPPELLVPVPLHPLRERAREFNQAAVLAAALSNRTGIPSRSVLRRLVPTKSQTLLNRWQRRRNLKGAFALRQNKPLGPVHAMLVDDVLTTGSTLEECSKALLAGGARAVSAITVARA